MLPTMQVLVEYVMYVSQGGIQMSTEGMLSISVTRGVHYYLMVWMTNRRIGVPTAKLLCKDIDTRGWR